MIKNDELTDHYRALIQLALHGEITSNMRAVAIFLSGGSFLLKFYFDRDPTEDDVEVASVVGSNLGAMVGFDNSVISKIREECVHSLEDLDNIIMRDDLVFARREDKYFL